MQVVVEVLVVAAVELITTLPGATLDWMRSAQVGCALRSAWASLIGVPIEFVLIAGFIDGGGRLTLFHAADSANIACNRASLNSTESIFSALSSTNALAASRRLRETSLHYNNARSLDLSLSTPVGAAAAGISSAALNILSRSAAVANAIAESITTLQPAMIATALTYALANATLGNVTISAGLMSGSVTTLQVLYTRKTYAPSSLTRLTAANAGAVVGSAAAAAVLIVLLIWVKQSGVARATVRKVADEGAATREFRSRLLRARVRTRLRVLARFLRIGGRSAVSQMTLGAHEEPTRAEAKVPDHLQSADVKEDKDSASISVKACNDEESFPAALHLDGFLDMVPALAPAVQSPSISQPYNELLERINEESSSTRILLRIMLPPPPSLPCAVDEEAYPDATFAAVETDIDAADEPPPPPPSTMPLLLQASAAMARPTTLLNDVFARTGVPATASRLPLQLQRKGQT